jgi:hypothetical protein
MGLALLAVLGLAWWLHRDGLLVPNLVRLGGTAALGLLAFRLLTTGRVVMTRWRWPSARADCIATSRATARSPIAI